MIKVCKRSAGWIRVCFTPVFLAIFLPGIIMDTVSKACDEIEALINAQAPIGFNNLNDIINIDNIKKGVIDLDSMKPVKSRL